MGKSSMLCVVAGMMFAVLRCAQANPTYYTYATAGSVNLGTGSGQTFSSSAMSYNPTTSGNHNVYCGGCILVELRAPSKEYCISVKCGNANSFARVHIAECTADPRINGNSVYANMDMAVTTDWSASRVPLTYEHVWLRINYSVPTANYNSYNSNSIQVHIGNAKKENSDTTSMPSAPKYATINLISESVVVTSLTKKVGTTGYELPVPEWSGHTFMGWRKSETNTLLATSRDRVYNDFSLYAWWANDNNVTAIDSFSYYTDSKHGDDSKWIRLSDGTYRSYRSGDVNGAKMRSEPGKSTSMTTPWLNIQDDETVLAFQYKGSICSYFYFRVYEDSKLLLEWNGNRFDYSWFNYITIPLSKGRHRLKFELKQEGSATSPITSGNCVWLKNICLLKPCAFQNVVFDYGEASIVGIEGERVESGRFEIGEAYGWLPSPTWVEHEFCGWFSDRGQTESVDVNTKAKTSVERLYAKWKAKVVEPTPTTYAVAYNPGRHGAGSQQTATKTQGAALTLRGAIFTRSGYMQTGWTTVDGGSREYGLSAAYMVDANVTLYPCWTANSYQVTLDQQGGSGGTASVAATYGSPMPPISTPTRAGCTFGGYYDAENGNGMQYYTASGASARAWDKTGATALYAAWSDVSGESDSDAASTVKAIVIRGDDRALLMDGVVCSCVAIMSDGKEREVVPVWSWATDESYSTAAVPFTISASGVLSPTQYAKAPATVVVKASYATGGVVLSASKEVKYVRAVVCYFDAGKGTASETVRTYMYGSALGELPTAERAGYKFTGWFDSAIGGERITEDTYVTRVASPYYYYAHWAVERDGEVEGVPYLYETVEGSVPVSASEYNGYLYDTAGKVKGTIQVKVAKPNAKTGLASVKATLQLTGQKKLTLKAADGGKAEIAEDGPTKVVLPGGEVCDLTLGENGISGSYGGMSIDGARNFFASKDKEEQNDANAALEKLPGAINVKFDGGTASVVKAKKGKIKAAVVLDNGTKESVNAMILAGEDGWCIPVVAPKKAKVAFTVWIAADGAMTVSGLPGAIAGTLRTPSRSLAFAIEGGVEAWVDAGLPGETAFLPDGFSFEGGAKWKCAKADVIKYKNGAFETVKDNGNPSGLKLTYKAKDGSFKGSFKAYAIVKGKLKKQIVNISGVMIDGKGYGSAAIKKTGSVAITIK